MILSGCFGWTKKEIVDLAMGRKKSLSVSRGFEVLHDPLTSSGWLVRIFCAIVEAFVLAMFDAGHGLALCRAASTEFVGDHDARGPHLRLRRRRLAAALFRRLWIRISSSTPF